MKLSDFLTRLNETFTKVLDVFVLVDEVIPTAKAALEGRLTGGEAKQANELLAKLEEAVPKASQQLKSINPSAKTPTPDSPASEPMEETEIPEEAEEIDIPVEEKKNEEVGIPGLPELNFSA